MCSEGILIRNYAEFAHNSMVIVVRLSLSRMENLTIARGRNFGMFVYCRSVALAVVISARTLTTDTCN